MTLFDDTFRTITAATEGDFRDRGSKFLAFAYPIRSEADARTYLDTLRKIHPKANHHCYAYRLGLDRSHYRVNDDGEPSGTAGRPILNVLLSRDLTNILVVVVRYFGGTLLGVPGLINAYKLATVAALDVATVVEKTVNEVYRLRFPFEQMNDVMRIVKEHQLTILKQDFDTACLLDLELRRTLVEVVLGKLGKLDGVETKSVGQGA
ncbi:YigZ family protein [Fibrella sp. WM1]|uniref:IMPACT family protein n=1 Tax=Fibrella musci TaxID=3242485 RepID=UPI003520FD26